MRRVFLIMALFAVLLGWAGTAPSCARADEPGAALKVVVTIAPLKGLVEPLLPAGSTVKVLMQPGKSEHGYEFTPEDVAAVAKADVVVYVGLGLEGRLGATINKAGAAGRRVVCFADAIGIKAGADDPHEGEGEHGHGPEGGHVEGHEHEHGAGYVDPHLWLDPVLVEALIPELERAVLEASDSASSTRVKEAAAALREKVKAVDKEWTDRLAPLKGKSVVTHHNAFSRPAERYGFKVAAVIREFETSEPSPGDIARVVEAIRKEHVKTIFVEPQFNAGAAGKIASRAAVKVGHLDPLGDGDWFKMMKANLDALVSGLSDGQADEKPATKPGAPAAGGK